MKPSCRGTYVTIPGATISSCPLKGAQLASHRSPSAYRSVVPDMLAGLHPFENVKVPIFSCHVSSIPGQVAAVFPHPLQHSQVPVYNSDMTRVFVPGTTLGPRPLNNVQVPSAGSVEDDAPKPLGTV